jgi:cob(I)alamin adenosyltransferase
MSEKKKFKYPEITISKVYTKTGDAGETGLVGGQRVPKDHVRIEAYGEVDELNATIGGCREAIRDHLDGHGELKDVFDILHRIQHELFNTGTILATMPEDITPNLPCVTDEDIQRLEDEMDRFNHDLPTLHSFVLSGGSKANIWFHMARNICRRAERRSITLSREHGLDPLVIKYLNRLSDALFVYSRWVNHAIGCTEVTWDPNISDK